MSDTEEKKLRVTRSAARRFGSVEKEILTGGRLTPSIILKPISENDKISENVTSSPRALRTRTRKNTTDDESGVATTIKSSTYDTPIKPILMVETTSTRRSTRRLSSDAVITLTPSKVSTPSRRSTRLNSEDSNHSLIINQPTFSRKKIPAPLIEEDESKLSLSTPAGSRTSRIATRSSSQSPNVSDQSLKNTSFSGSQETEKRVKSPDKNNKNNKSVLESGSEKKTTEDNLIDEEKENDKSDDGEKSKVFIDLITPYKSTPKLIYAGNDTVNDTNISTLVLNDSTLAHIIPDDSMLNETISPKKKSQTKRLSVSLYVDDCSKFKISPRNKSDSEGPGNNNTTLLEDENLNSKNDVQSGENNSSPQKRKSNLLLSESNLSKKSIEKAQVKDDSFSKSWSQPIKNSMDATQNKIDYFGKVKSPQKELNKNSPSSRHSKSINVIEDSNDDDNEYEAMDIDEEDDEEPERNSLIDDEAEECEDEDSLDSEERQYLKDNEIPQHGIELGSDDSVHEGGEEEEEEISNDSFVVSDDEEIELENDGNDDDIPFIDDSPKNSSTKKNRRRIVEPSDSSENDDANDSKSKIKSPNQKFAGNKTEFYQDTKLKHFNGTIENNLAGSDDLKERNESNQAMKLDGPIKQSQMVHDIEATPLKNKILNHKPIAKTPPLKNNKSPSSKKENLSSELKAVIDEFFTNEIELNDYKKNENFDSIEIDLGKSDETLKQNISLHDNSNKIQNSLSHTQIEKCSNAVTPLESKSPKHSNTTPNLLKGILKTSYQIDITAQSTPKNIKSPIKSQARKSLEKGSKDFEIENNPKIIFEPTDTRNMSLNLEEASVSQKKTPKKSISYNIPVEDIEKRINEILQKKEEEKKMNRQQTPRRLKENKKRQTSKPFDNSLLGENLDISKISEPQFSSDSEEEEEIKIPELSDSEIEEPSVKIRDTKSIALSQMSNTPILQSGKNISKLAFQEPFHEPQEDVTAVVEDNEMDHENIDETQQDELIDNSLKLISSSFSKKSKSAKSKSKGPSKTEMHLEMPPEFENNKDEIIEEHKDESVRLLEFIASTLDDSTKNKKLNKKAKSVSPGVKQTNQSKKQNISLTALPTAQPHRLSLLTSTLKNDFMNVSKTKSGDFVEEEFDGSYETILSDVDVKEMKLKAKLDKKNKKKADKLLAAKLTEKDQKVIQRLDEDLQIVHAEITKKRLLEQSSHSEKGEKLQKKKKSKVIEDKIINEENKKLKEKKIKVSKENVDALEPSLKPKKKVLNILNKKVNPAIEEPITPLSHIQNGFRESPITPKISNGFKVTPITPITSHEKRNRQNLKRKLSNIKEPTHVPPKVVWARSGAFAVESAKSKEKTIPTSSATEFKISVLGNKTKNIKMHLPQEDTASTAMNFKKNKLYQQGMNRVAAKEILSNYEKSRFSQFHK